MQYGQVLRLKHAHACLLLLIIHTSQVALVVANYCCGSEVYVSSPQAEEAWIETFHTSNRSIQFLHSVKL